MKIRRFRKHRLKVDDYVWYDGDPSCLRGIYTISVIGKSQYPYYIKSITQGGANFVTKFQVHNSGQEFSQWVSEDEIEYISNDYRDLDMFLDMKKYNL